MDAISPAPQSKESLLVLQKAEFPPSFPLTFSKHFAFWTVISLNFRHLIMFLYFCFWTFFWEYNVNRNCQLDITCYFLSFFVLYAYANFAKVQNAGKVWLRLHSTDILTAWTIHASRSKIEGRPGSIRQMLLRGSSIEQWPTVVWTGRLGYIRIRRRNQIVSATLTKASQSVSMDTIGGYAGIPDVSFLYHDPFCLNSSWRI